MGHLCDKTNQFSRRDFLTKTGMGLGGMALASLINPQEIFARAAVNPSDGVLGSPHFLPKVKRVIYLFQSGGPSQLELFDYKPLLRK